MLEPLMLDNRLLQKFRVQVLCGIFTEVCTMHVLSSFAQTFRGAIKETRCELSHHQSQGEIDPKREIIPNSVLKTKRAEPIFRGGS